MGYGTILAYLPTETQAKVALPVATALARGGRGHLTGLYVVPMMRLYAASPYGGADVTAQLMEQHQSFHADQSAKVRGVFEQATAAADFAADWAVADSPYVDPLETIMSFGRAAELIVAVPDGREGGEWPDAAVAERLMVEAGRPVLLVPPIREFRSLGRDVTVAWNGSRESARAVFDALPLLQDAEIVHIVWVDPKVEAGESPSRAANALAAALSRRGVNCDTIEAGSGGRSVAEELLGRVADYGSDLLVMGGYGRSRFRELVFGGVTRKVLAEMPVPVLMSH